MRAGSRLSLIVQYFGDSVDLRAHAYNISELSRGAEVSHLSIIRISCLFLEVAARQAKLEIILKWIRSKKNQIDFKLGRNFSTSTSSITAKEIK